VDDYPSQKRHRCSSPDTCRAGPDALRITVQPTRSGRKWIARVGDRVLCVSAAPFVKSARSLLAEGYPADSLIEMWRPDAAGWALRGRLGVVAATVIDGEKASRDTKNGVPVRLKLRAGDGGDSE
jgi:hypothetical protein